MSTSIIINRGAGSGVDVEGLRPLLSRLGEIEVELTCSPEHTESCAQRAMESGYRRIVAGGGDGTVNRVLNGLMKAAGRADGLRDVELGILPLGTGNDFSHSIGMNLALNEAVDALVAWETRPIDIVRLEARSAGGEDTVRCFVNASAGGFVKSVGEATDSGLKRSILGSLSYAFTAAASLNDIDHYNLMVAVDGCELGHRAMASVVSNGRTIGGGVEVAPDAVLDDGLIESLVIPEAPLAELLFAGLETVVGSAGMSWVAEVRRGREIAMVSDPPLPLSADGEAVGLTPARYTVLPRALRVVFGG